MAHAALAGPFGERHFGDELRAHPMALHVARLVLEGRLVGLEVGELLLERAQRGVVEAGADVARVAQLSLRVVDAEQERAEAAAAALRIGEAAHDELLALRALELDPRGRSRRRVRRLGALADEALEPLVARGFQKILRRTLEVLAEAHAVGLAIGEDRGEQRSALAQR